jgi:hypothetical protein
MGATYKKFENYYSLHNNKTDLKLKIQDARAQGGPNCGTDHKLLVAKTLFPYMFITKDKHEEKKENTVTMVHKKRKYNMKVYKMKVQNFYINRDLIIN